MTTKATHISRFFSTEDVANGTISVAKLSNIYTSNVIEHVNLYFTTQRARDSFSAGTGVSIQAGNISIGQPVYTNNSVSFNNLTLTGELRGPSTLVLDPAAIGDDTGTVQIRGNLQVDGTTTTINSTTLTVDDLNIVLAQGAANAAAASGAGISIDGANATLTYASSTDTWNVNKNLLITPGTANGILYLNGSKVATSGSALTFNGTTLDVNAADVSVVNSYSQGILTVGVNNGVSSRLQLQGAESIRFTTYSSSWQERMRIASTGAIQMGTTTSTVGTLNVAKSAASGLQYVLALTAAQGTGYDRGAAIAFPVNESTSTTLAYIGTRVDLGASGDNAQAIVFGTNQTDSSPVERVRISSGGYLGIGTSSPAAKLDVYDSSAAVQFVRSSTSALRFVSTGGTNYIQSGTGTGNSNAPLVFTTVNAITEWARFDSSGNLGIGTNPGVKLDVNGTARATSLRTSFGAVYGSSFGVLTAQANTNYTGWYRIARSGLASASYGLRGGAKIYISGTGNYLAPTQDVIKLYKDWSSAKVIASVENYLGSYWSQFRVVSDTNYTYLEGYLNGLNIGGNSDFYVTVEAYGHHPEYWTAFSENLTAGLVSPVGIFVFDKLGYSDALFGNQLVGYQGVYSGSVRLGQIQTDIMRMWRSADIQGYKVDYGDGGGINYTWDNSIVRIDTSIGSHNWEIGKIYLPAGKYQLILQYRPSPTVHGWNVYGTNSNAHVIRLISDAGYGAYTTYLEVYAPQINKDLGYSITYTSSTYTAAAGTYRINMGTDPYGGGGYKYFVESAYLIRLT
jgi:hypothetical protein